MSDFKCIADKCAHTCCKGWEIDIDDETYEIYLGIAGPFGDKIRSSIATKKNPESGDEFHHFVLSEDERCPFLNERNLCEIILNLGEDYLCDICTEHPRFYKERESGEYVCGYGLCCEEAARLTLFGDLNYAVKCGLSNDGVISEGKCTELFRERIEKEINPETLSKLCQLLPTLESIEPGWRGNVVKLCKLKPESILINFSNSVLQSSPVFTAAFENLYEYMVFRYDSDRYALYMCCVTMLICERIEAEKGDFSQEDMIEVVRSYSADIEYSDENVEKIMKVID